MLTDAEKENYEARIKNVASIYDEVAALSKAEEAARKKAEASAAAL